MSPATRSSGHAQRVSVSSSSDPITEQLNSPRQAHDNPSDLHLPPGSSEAVSEKLFPSELATLDPRTIQTIVQTVLQTQQTQRAQETEKGPKVSRKELEYDIPKFKIDFNLQQRLNWLYLLDTQFEATPIKFENTKLRIFEAVMHMDDSYQQRWFRHLDEKSPEEKERLRNSWSYFEKWTLTLIRNAASLEAEVMGQLNRARQRHGQSPTEFHNYIDSLEQHFPRAEEKERALSYLAKLEDDLRRTIRQHVIDLPVTRQGMIDVAMHFWELDKSKYKRKHDKSPTASDFNKKRKERIHQKGGKNNEKPSKPRQNILGKDGKRLRCYICDSEEHLANRCPDKTDKSNGISKKRANIQSIKNDPQDGSSSENDDGLM